MHLLIFCPETQHAWNIVQEKWRSLIGTFEDFIDDQTIELHQYHKLFGIETPTRPSKQNPVIWNKYVLIQSLDILIMNMQYLVIKQFKQYLYDMKRPSTKELQHAFDHSMADAINKIYTRMNRPGYKNNWIFSRPRRKLVNTTKDAWLAALTELINLTLIPVSEEPPIDDEWIEISSDLDEEEIIDTFPPSIPIN